MASAPKIVSKFVIYAQNLVNQVVSILSALKNVLSLVILYSAIYHVQKVSLVNILASVYVDSYAQIFKAEKDVLYVRLDDCGHLFDYQYLDEWMKPQQESQLIRLKGCPKCQTPIMSCARYMSQINQTLNDINVNKALILEQDQQLEAEFNRIKEQMLNLQGKLKISYKLDQNFGDLNKTYKELIMHFNFSKGHRNTDLLNKVVIKLNFLNLLFVFAKYIRESYMYSIDQTVVKNQFKTYCSQKEDLNKITIEQDYNVLKEFSKKYKSIQYVDEIAKIPNFSKAPWNKCMNGHYYQSRNSDDISQGCPDCIN